MLLRYATQLVLATVFIILGWLYLDRFDSLLARGIVITILGFVMLNGVIVSMLCKAFARHQPFHERMSNLPV
jgi:hypothetical protein